MRDTTNVFNVVIAFALATATAHAQEPHSTSQFLDQLHPNQFVRVSPVYDTPSAPIQIELLTNDQGKEANSNGNQNLKKLNDKYQDVLAKRDETLQDRDQELDRHIPARRSPTRATFTSKAYELTKLLEELSSQRRKLNDAIREQEQHLQELLPVKEVGADYFSVANENLTRIYPTHRIVQIVEPITESAPHDEQPAANQSNKTAAKDVPAESLSENKTFSDFLQPDQYVRTQDSKHGIHFDLITKDEHEFVEQLSQEYNDQLDSAKKKLVGLFNAYREKTMRNRPERPGVDPRSRQPASFSAREIQMTLTIERGLPFSPSGANSEEEARITRADEYLRLLQYHNPQHFGQVIAHGDGFIRVKYAHQIVTYSVAHILEIEQKPFTRPQLESDADEITDESQSPTATENQPVEQPSKINSDSD